MLLSVLLLKIKVKTVLKRNFQVRKVIYIKEGKFMNKRTLEILGTIATCTAMFMYISYFPQIINNFHGKKSGFLQPMVAAINCTLWVCYGFFQEKKEWPIIIANLPGVVFGAVAAISAL